MATREEEEVHGKEEGQRSPSAPSLVKSTASTSGGPTAEGTTSRSQSKYGARGPDYDFKALHRLAEAASSSHSHQTYLDRLLNMMSTETQDCSPQTHENESKAEKASNISARKNASANVVQNLAVRAAPEFERETLCRRWGERVWNDIAEVTIYTMFDIEHSDEAMIVRVKDLVRPISWRDLQQHC